ncbi:MAG: amidase [Rubricoccaceae bacterium]
MPLDRRAFVARVAALGTGSALLPGVLWAQAARGPITPETVRAAEALAGITLTDAQREALVADLQQTAEGADAVRAMRMPNAVPPAVRFDPFGPAGLAPRALAEGGPAFALPDPGPVPAAEADLAFASVADLGAWLAAGAVTSRRLTTLALERLERYDPTLRCTVRTLPARALAAADAADARRAAGARRGPLDGVPYGVKDLLAVAGAPTEWGTPPFAGQTFAADAAAVRRLDAAGAVLVAKLALGELAWGDVWAGGRTNNPWNVDVGSSGSSAGSAAAVAAGLVPFALGSETLGSIVSPSTRCGVTGLRPTFGAVSRAGAMALSWTMDKLGPLARSALDCALVFDALRGADPEDAPERDAAARDVPFPFDPARPLATLRAGVLEPVPPPAGAPAAARATYEATVAAQAVVRRLLAEAGAPPPRPFALPEGFPASYLASLLSVEGAAAFDALVTEGGLDAMVRQTPDSWPHVFRAARFTTAVDYVQALRARTRLMEATARAFGDLEVVVAPSFAPGLLQVTNLTGHPCVVVPHGFLPVEGHPERRQPVSFSFVGGLDCDAEALRLAHAFQQATDWHRRRPPVGA